MDPVIQRWQIAQTLVQNLVNFLAATQRPTHGQVQAVLDQSAAQLKALDTQAQPPQTPITVPNIVPSPTTTAQPASS